MRTGYSFKVALAFLFAFRATNFCAKAETDARTSLNVVVSNAITGAPLSAVKVVVSATNMVVAYTDSTGRAQFADLSPMQYRILVLSPGYVTQHAALTLTLNAVSNLDVSLAPVGTPKVIGSVKARTQPALGAESSSSNSNLANIGGGLGSDLRHLPDLDSIGNGFSIDGLSPGEAAVSIDGVSTLRGPNNALLSDIGLDLFSSVTASPVGAPGGPGLNLTTDDPTLAFRIDGNVRDDTFSDGSGQIEARGTSGYFGYVLKGVTRRETTSLNNSTFLDESGLSNLHTSEVQGDGILGKFRLPLGETQSVIFETSLIHNNDQLSCDIASGGTPCSYGPGNATIADFSQYALRYHAMLGPTAIDSSIGYSNSSSLINDLDRLVNLVHEPLVANNQSRGLDADIRVSFPIGERNQVGLDLNSTDQLNSFSTAMIPLQSFSSRFTSLTAFLDSKNSSGFRTNLTAEYSHSLVSHVSSILRNRLDFSSHDNISTRVSLNDSSVPPLQNVPQLGNISDPASIQYDCLHRHAFAAVNGDSPVDPTDSGAGFDLSHQRGRMAIRVSGSHDVVSGAQVATISTTSNFDGAISAAQLAGINQMYMSNAACGSAEPLSVSDIYLAQQQNAKVIRDRATVSAAASFPAFTFAPYFQINVSRFKTVRGFAPILYVPTLKAGAIGDYLFPHTETELIAFIDFTGTHNASGLGPYTTANIGLTRHLHSGATLTVSDTNITDTYSKKFASSQFAAPLVNGVLPIAQPLPRSIARVTLSFNLGSATPPSRIDPLAALSALGQSSTELFETSVSLLPSVPPKDPFVIDRDSPQCGPEIAGRASEILSEIRRAARMSPRPYIQTDQSAKSLETTIVEEVSGRPSFALTFKNTRSFQAFSVCVPQHFLDVEDAKSRKIFVPLVLTSDSNNTQFFDSIFGEYTLLGKIPSEAKNTKDEAAVASLDRFSNVSPQRQFEIRSSCPSNLVPYATEVLNALELHFSGQRVNKLQNDENLFLVQEHRGKVDWFALQFSDPSAFANLVQCAHVVGATKTELQSLSIGESSGLNYAASIGLYVSVP